MQIDRVARLDRPVVGTPSPSQPALESTGEASPVDEYVRSDGNPVKEVQLATAVSHEMIGVPPCIYEEPLFDQRFFHNDMAVTWPQI